VSQSLGQAFYKLFFDVRVPIGALMKASLQDLSMAHLVE
jgi:hypothetical protein